MTWTARELGLTNLAAKQQGFEDRWAVVQARYDAADARWGPPNRLTVQARATYKATVRGHYGLTSSVNSAAGEIRDQLIRARHRVRVRNGVAA